MELDRVAGHLHECVLQRRLLNSKAGQPNLMLERHITDRLGGDASDLEQPTIGVPVRTLVSDLGLVESSRWHDERLWFADWIAGEVIAVGTEGRSEVMIRHQSLPLCFDFLSDATPVIVSGPERALLKGAPDGSLTTYADLSPLSEHGGNDIVVDGRGNAYVNNPNYNAMAGTPPTGDIAPGFVALVTPDGDARVVATDLGFPNGMAVAPDNNTLVVAESHRNRLTAFRHRRRWHAVGTAYMGRARVRNPGRNLHRCRKCGLVRRCAQQALRPRPRGRRSGPDGGARSRRLRVHARRQRRDDFVHRRGTLARHGGPR